jgi:hypothetical protein
LSELARFFDSLYGTETGYAHLVTFGEDDSPSSQRAFEWPKDRSFMLKYAKIRGDEDLYTGTSLSSTEDRSSETATVTHAVYSDGDTCPPEALRLPPILTLVTSPGRYHYWWFLDEAVSAQEASDASRRIAYAHREQGMDLGFARAKLLRVPGTTNTKYDEPFAIESTWTDDVYTLDTINDVYGDIDIAPQVEISKTVPKPVPEDRLRELEDQLDNAGLSHLYLERPQDGQSWSERLFRLELDLFRLGMTPQEVFSVALESAPNKYNPDNAGARTQSGVRIPKRNDPAGVLWRDVQKAYGEFLAEENVPVEVRDTRTFTKANFLSVDERKYVTENPSFIDEYTAWVAKRTDSSETYQRSFAWLLLSTFYGGRGYVRLRWQRVELNLWLLVLGDTTRTRKSTAKSFYLRAVHAYEAQTGEQLDIGSEATPEALVKVLGTRDGEVSVLHKDEVVGMFREFLAKNYMSGAIETFTELYDGNVPVVLRTSKDGGNKNRARTIYNFVGVGIRKLTAETLTKSHFESGYLARMLWSVADPTPRQVGSEDIAFADEHTAADRKAMDSEILEIIKPFLQNEKKFNREFPTSIGFDKAAQTRYNKWAEEGMSLAERYGDDDILVPSFGRLEVSIIKASALLAMHDGVDKVTLKHLLPALAQSELWFNDMARMAAEVSSSEFERRCNDIEGFIASGADQKRLDSAVRKRFAKYKPAEYDEIIRALQAQGRVRHPSGENGRQSWEAL